MKRIVSSVPGRLRLRDPALRRPQPLQRLSAALEALAGVLFVDANARAGSVVVFYDEARVNRQEAEAAVEALAGAALGAYPPAGQAGQPRAGARPPRSASLRVRINRQAKRGMLASLATSLLLAGGKRWHAASGGVFLAFLAIHLAVHRRHLLR